MDKPMDQSVCSCFTVVTMKLVFCSLLLTTLISPSVHSKRLVGPQYRTATTCENSVLEIICEKDTHINLIRANFGRFSIQTCNEFGSQEMKVDCMSTISFRVVEESCGMKQSCVIAATSVYFGDPCPGTPKYLEAHYQCLPDNQKKRYRWQSTTPRAKLPGKQLSSLSSSSSSASSASSSTLPPVVIEGNRSTSSTAQRTEPLKPDSVGSHLGPVNVTRMENSMKNGLTHPHLDYSVAAGTSTPRINNVNLSRFDSKSETTSSLTKSGAHQPHQNNKSNSIEMRLPSQPTIASTSTGSSSSSVSTLSSPQSTGKSIEARYPEPLEKLIHSNGSGSSLEPAKALLSTATTNATSPLTIVKVTNDFDDRPIYIKHPHPGATSASPEIAIIPSFESSNSNRNRGSKSDFQSPYSSYHKSHDNLPASPSSASSESDYSHAYESSSSSANGRTNKESELEETSIYIRHPHPGNYRDPSSSSSSPSSITQKSPSTTTGYDISGDQWIKIDPSSMMINETIVTNQLSNDSWLSNNLSTSNLMTSLIFALATALSAMGVFFYIYLRDTNLKSRFWSLASALNGKIVCSRNIGPLEPGASLKDEVATLRKRGGHLISVTPTSRYMSSENAAHYIRDPIIGPGSGSTLNVITPLGVNYLVPNPAPTAPSATNTGSSLGGGNVNLAASVKDLTYGCSQLTAATTGTTTGQSFPVSLQQQQKMLLPISTTTRQGILGLSVHNQHAHHHHHHLHHLRPTATAKGLPFGLVVEHVYECIDDDPYTAKLFMPVDCDTGKYQRRDNSIYNGGDFMSPINTTKQQQQMAMSIQHQHQQKAQQPTDLTTTIQALPAIVQENVSTLQPPALHHQLNFACYPCQSQVASYINKERIEAQMRDNLALMNANSDSRRPEIV